MSRRAARDDGAGKTTTGHALAERAIVVWLDLPVAELVDRMATSDHRRPMLEDEAQVVLDRRRDGYAEVADLHHAAIRDTGQLVAAIVAALDVQPQTYGVREQRTCG